MCVMPEDAQYGEYLDECYTMKRFCDGFTPTCQDCSRKSSVFSKCQSTAA